MAKKNGKVSLTTKISNAMEVPKQKAEQVYAAAMFDEETVKDKAMNGTHRGEAMRDIYRKIMSDDRIEHVQDEKNPDLYTMKFKQLDMNIGWYDKGKMYGNINQQAYDNISKHYDEMVQAENLDSFDIPDAPEDDGIGY